MTTHNLNTPLTRADILQLHAGDLVYLSGTIITARDRAHERILHSPEIPFDLEGAAIYHCGPIMRRGQEGRGGNNCEGAQWTVVAAGPTTSSRLNSQTPDLLNRFHVHATIGKGGMSVTDAMRDRCVYLAYTGGCAAIAADHIDSVRDVHWLDLGMAEAVWVLDVHNFGPLIVGIDAHGRNLFSEVQERARDRLSILS